MTDMVEKFSNWQQKVDHREKTVRRDRYGKKTERIKRDNGASMNDLTGDNMFVGSDSDRYRENYDRIFGKK